MSLPGELPREVSFVVAVYFNMREPIPDPALALSACLHPSSSKGYHLVQSRCLQG